MTLGGKTLEDLVGPISKQQGRQAPAASVHAPEKQPVPARATDGLKGEALVEMFAQEAEKVRVTVHRCAANDLAGCIADIIASDGAGSVVLADDDRFAACGLAEALGEQDSVTAVHVWGSSLGRQNVEFARTARYGVTYAIAGIAETATIAQPASARCGRSISLLPLVHIAVVEATAIVGTMGDVLAGVQEGGEGLPSQLCFISGPSATADIELVRVEGVHGPMYVHYVIVE